MEYKLDCGCYLYTTLSESMPIDIIYCPKHKAAPDMYEALTIALPFIDSEEIQSIIREALAKAGGN